MPGFTVPRVHVPGRRNTPCGRAEGEEGASRRLSVRTNAQWCQAAFGDQGWFFHYLCLATTSTLALLLPLHDKSLCQ